MPDRDGSVPRLQDRILKAQRAIRRAGFVPGRFTPSADRLRVDVSVPVWFTNGTLESSDDTLIEFVKQAIRSAASSPDRIAITVPESIQPCSISNLEITSDDPAPLDRRTKEYKEWKSRRAEAAV